MLSKKILLLSADSSMTRSMATCLIQSGFKVVHTTRGFGALELIHTVKPVLIILDIELPDFNSLAIIRSLRANQQNHRIPIILFGSNLKEEDVLIGIEVGADLCLLETFHPQVFVARVRSLLRRAELLKTN